MNKTGVNSTMKKDHYQALHQSTQLHANFRIGVGEATGCELGQVSELRQTL